MDNQVYFNGDFWQCVEETSAGESPTTAPTKWRRIRIPSEFRQVLKKLTYANLLELDGQTDKAAVHRGSGESLLDDLVREAANQERTRHSGSVHALQGQTVKASVILDDAYGLMRWDIEDLEDSEKQDGRRSLSAALQQVWEAWWWGSLMVLETSALRESYSDAEFCEPGTERYFPATQKYYVAIQPVIAIAPARLENGGYVPNSGFWAESKNRYSASDVDNTQAYAWGTQVRNPSDGLFYQRGGSFEVSGTATGLDDPNGVYTITPRDINPGTRVSWWTGSLGPAATQKSTFEISSFWQFIARAVIVFAKYSDESGTDRVSPDLVESWVINPGDPGSLPGPTISTEFVAPAVPDSGSWGLLTPFDHVLAIARKVRSVSKQNPQVSHNPEAYHIEPVDGGVCVRDWKCGTAWVWSRRVTPILTGDDYESTTTYEATPETDIVFDA